MARFKPRNALMAVAGFTLGAMLWPDFAASAEPRVIRLSVDNPAGNDRAAVEEKFAELVGQLSGGELRVEIYYGGSLGGMEATAIQSLKAGGAEMAIVGTANFTRFDKRWSMFDLPFLFYSPAHLYKYLEGPQFERLASSTAQQGGLHYIFPYYSGWRQLVTTKKKVTTLADENGLKLRATGSPVEIAYDRAFGAKPVSVPWNETYLALKQGLVDGFMIGYTDIANFKMGDAVAFGATLNVAPEIVMAFMREDYFQALPNKLQGVIQAAGRQTEAFAQSVAAKEEHSAREYLTKLGVEIYDVPPVARQEWISVAQPVFGKFREVLPEDEQAAIQKGWDSAPAAPVVAGEAAARQLSLEHRQ